MTEERLSPTEAGLSHPLTNCVVTLTDDGRILLMAGDDCGIVLDQETGVISIFGTEIRLLSEDVKVNGRNVSSVALEARNKTVAPGTQIRRIDKAKE